MQRVSLNPLKCQELHLLFHLKWEYFCSFFVVVFILIWFFGVCDRARSPDANSEENVLSDKGVDGEMKMNEVGKWYIDDKNE